MVGDNNQMMKTKFSLYFLAITIGLLLTACSSNDVKPENKQVTNSVSVKKQVVNRSRPERKKQVASNSNKLAKKNITKKRTYIKPKRPISNYKKRNFSQLAS